jgi:hypothetical protein
MSKRRILVKEAGLMNFFKSFFNAKANNKESEWLTKLRKADPDLADIWSDYDKSMNKSMQTQRDILKRRGLDTSKIDDFLKNR